MKVSIQGNLASYSHIAADQVFGSEIDLLQRGSFREVFEDLKSGLADVTVVPIENSTYGSIYQNYDNITNYSVSLVGEVYVKVNFHLIGHKGKLLKDITDIYVHPVARGQIKPFELAHPEIKFHEHEDTAGSVKMVAENNMITSAGCASKMAAKVYNLEILEDNIHENPKNYTRFYVISRPEDEGEIKRIVNNEDNGYKTTFQFTLGSEAGSLYKTLRAFADRDLSLTKIESRPVIGTDWEYRFYVDVAAGMADEALNNALKELSSYVEKLKILGSYVKGEYVNS
ncbi:MAG: prephenate dehydratase domain-containing protein [Candidatus Dojkabacteria bacterium]|nr:prephenate dehydratase domain-containing protein [Candidatus Dojkabacteria bacterium]MDQ7021390.1 prephenate dehydratase domain-containing protein [Candidatus Dojkabacteria bacterium]